MVTGKTREENDMREFSGRLFVTLVLLAVLPAPACFAAELTGDRIPTDKGPLTIHPLEHATFILAWDDNIIDFDPVGGEAMFDDLPAPDLIFITDIHRDHLNVETLSSLIKSNTQIVAPPAVVEKLPAPLKNRTQSLRNGESLEIAGIQVQAIPMYNLPETPDAYHTKGRGNGYLLTMGGRRIYVSGDTDDIPEMRELENFDVAFVCMNPPYTMSVETAADAVLDFKPRIVYPFHYRSPDGLTDVKKFKELVSKNGDIEVRLRDWYPQD